MDIDTKIIDAICLLQITEQCMLELIKQYKTACMFILAVFLSLFGCGLLTAGFIVAPMGIIDSSVMISAGEVFTFAGSVLGINATYRSRLEGKQ